ncbi:MAG: type II secretion system protein GspG [Acidobacteriota bacterium]|nr:type II secretion system protein GspG [Acidobacteriota bacterium]
MNGRRTTTRKTIVSPVLVSSVVACLSAACLACLVPQSRAAKSPKAALKKSDAQKLVAAYSLLELNKGAVSVKEITPGETAATVTAVLRVGFRFERDAKDRWHAVEMRVGDRQWEDLDLLSRALGNDSLTRARAALDSLAAELDALARARKQRDEEKKRAERDRKNSRGAKRPEAGGEVAQSDEKAAKSGEKSKKAKKSDQKTAEKQPELARGALSVNSPESALSPMGKSAVVETEIEAAFDVVREGGAWRVASARIGDAKLPDPEALARSLDAEKRKAARADLEALASALESFRRERGFYVVADSEAALVDFLNPRYTTGFIRVDPWHRPYEYTGTRDAFTLRSTGPDGKPNTADDVTVENTRPTRATKEDD